MGGGKTIKIQIEIKFKLLKSLLNLVSDKIGQIFCKMNFNQIPSVKNQSVYDNYTFLLT